MFAPDNEVIATVLLLGTMMCWGSWSSVRVLCRAEAPVFAIFYVGGQLLVGTSLGLTLGNVSVENSMFDRRTFVEGFTHPGDWYRVAAVFLGGFCCAFSDFLASCACTRIPFAVVVPIFMGWALMQATILNFLIEGGDDTNPLLLFAGVLCAFLAICSMAVSDSYAASPEEEISARVASHSRSGVSADASTLKALLPNSENDSSTQQHDGGMSWVNPWIFVSVFAGFLAGLWSPLSTFGRSKGSYPVDNPSVALFVFQLGSLSAVPLMLWCYGSIIQVHEKSPPSAPVAWSTYVTQAWQLPMSDKKYALLAGAIVSCGTYIFFTASQAISSTVAFAIGSCAPLVTISIGVIIFKQLRNAPFRQSFFLLLSTFLFILAITLMVLASSV